MSRLTPEELAKIDARMADRALPWLREYGMPELHREVDALRAELDSVRAERDKLIDEWAQRLAKDLVAAGESEYAAPTRKP